MTKYRKKPIVIDAWHVIPREQTGRLPPEWLVEAILQRTVKGQLDGSILIHTKEGIMQANVGDWIIKGIAGELYPCKPDIFEATYEAVDD